MEFSFYRLLLESGFVIKGIFILLIFMSLYSWAIIFLKIWVFRRADRQNEGFYELWRRSGRISEALNGAKKYPESPAASVLGALGREFSGSAPKKRSDVEHTIERAESREAQDLERHLGFLSTSATAAPFIGLFGTVWGLMEAFQSIGAAGSASLVVVAPGIAEALTTTAMGLFVAIPAVFAYNYYISRVDRMTQELETFSAELMDSLLSGSGSHQHQHQHQQQAAGGEQPQR